MPITKIATSSIELQYENYINILRAGQSVSDTGWSTYSNTAGVNPVSGIGGTASITWSQNTINPLSGDADLRLVKTGTANRQGDGVSIPFTIANRHLAKVLQISFDAELISGTYSNGDLRISVIQDPSGTPVLLEPVNTGIQLGIANQRIRHIATFQSHISITSYRLCVHVSSTTTNNYTIDFANFRVWEQTQTIGAIITDWQSYTPTFSWCTVSSSNISWRRVGGKIEVFGSMVIASVSSNPGLIPLPSGLSLDTSKLVPRSTILGTYNDIRVSSTSVNPWTNNSNWIGYDTSYPNAVRLFIQSSSALYNLENANIAIGTGDTVTFEFSAPIAGWGSSVAMSSDSGDGRVVACNYSGNPTLQGGNFVTFGTRQFDTHNAYNTSNGTYTCPVSGVYRISTSFGNTGTGLQVYINRSGVLVAYLFQTPANSTYVTSGSANVICNAGDTLKIAIGGSNALYSSDATQNISIERISAGSQVIATSETVACEVWSNTNISGSTTTNFIYNQVVRDTHGAWNTTTGIYTAPMSGWYSLNMYYNPTTLSSISIFLYKASVGGSLSIYKALISNASIQINNTITSGSFYLLSGEQISVRPSASITLNGTTTLAGNSTWLTINRIGI